jgi:acyl-coenzyme A thioesterase PaaI-like protein
MTTIAGEDDANAWLDEPEAGWTQLTPPEAVSSGTFVSGDPGGNRLRVRYFRRDHDGALRARVWFGPGTQGPPGHAHGGSMASILDEAMGAAAWAAGHAVVAAELTTRFRRMLPLGSCCIVEARVASTDGRKVRTVAELRTRGLDLVAEGEALFIELDPARFGELIDQASAILRPPPRDDR